MTLITDVLNEAGTFLAPEAKLALQALGYVIPEVKKYAPLGLAYVGGATGKLGQIVNAPHHKARRGRSKKRKGKKG